MGNNNVMNVMLGGQFPEELPESNLWCGVDRGALYLIDNGIKPDISCGDFDSVSNEQISSVKEYSKNFFVKDNQDETDTDFALKQIIKLYPEVSKINLFGATGKRLDHFFGNILLLNNNYDNLDLRIMDDYNIIFVSQCGESTFSSKKNYKYFSIVPIYQDTIMTIKNSKYEAENMLLSFDRPNATSNEFVEGKDIVLNVNKKVLVIYSKD